MDWLKRLFFKNTNRKATTCECGKYSKCCREMKTSWSNRSGRGKMWVESRDHYRCGKVQKTINDVKEAFTKNK
jgi:hypothetical protein